jgi:hypothetical protein
VVCQAAAGTKLTQASVVHTTQEHLFWDPTSRQWVDAGNLQPGESLSVAASHGSAVVGNLHSFAGHRFMNNLTVENLHTYYVLAGNTPVLVHNDSGIYSWPNTDGPFRSGSKPPCMLSSTSVPASS